MPGSTASSTAAAVAATVTGQVVRVARAVVATVARVETPARLAQTASVVVAAAVAPTWAAKARSSFGMQRLCSDTLVWMST